MALAEILITKLGTRLGKILLKAYLEDPAEAIGSELLDIAKGKIEGALDRRDAARWFERIGEKIASQLESLFESEFRHDEVSAEAVIHELAQALEGRISSEFFLRKDLDPAKITAELRKGHPLPKNQFSDAEEQLYDRALAEAVRYVVDVADKLPRFEKTNIRENLRRLSEIGAVVEEMAEKIRRIEGWVDLQKESPQDQQYEIDYRLAVMRNLDYVELFGADLSVEARRQSLSVAYVSLNLESQGVGEKDSIVSVLAESIFNGMTPDAGRLLIRGEAGSGKSTLFRWAAIRAALRSGDNAWFSKEDFLPGEKFAEKLEAKLRESLASHWSYRVPFLVRLRDCQGGSLPSPNEFPISIAKEIGDPPSSWVRNILLSGKALLLLDGVDEIPSANRELVRRDIEAIIRAYPSNYYVVSTRPEAVPPRWLAAYGFREARVNPMSDLDRERFIDKWHKAVETELARVGRSLVNISSLAQELKRKLPENPSVARLATNPLLCAMICALHSERRQRLPESQSELCEALCAALLHRRELESGLNVSSLPEPYARLTYPQKRAIVQDIAHFMVRNDESSISSERADQIIQSALHSLYGQLEEHASVVRQALVERSGMLRENKPGHIEFIHNTFKEFLAAERLVDLGDMGQLVQRSLEPTWQKVLEFAVAIPRPGVAEDLIERLIGSRSMLLRISQKVVVEDEVLRARQLLALRCKANALYLKPKLEADLNSLAKKLLPPRSMSDAEALASTGDLAVPFLRFNSELAESEAAACVRALRLIGTALASDALRGYLHDRRGSVVSELIQAVNPLSLPSVKESVLDTGVIAFELKSRIQDLEPLSELKELMALYLTAGLIWDLSPLSGLSRLHTLYLDDNRVRDLSPLANLFGLQTLSLVGNSVSDISPLSALSDLRVLYLSRTQVSNLAPLAKLSKLEVLYVDSTPVADLSPLSSLKSLVSLNISKTRVRDVSALFELDALYTLLLAEDQISNLSQLPDVKGLTRIRF